MRIKKGLDEDMDFFQQWPKDVKVGAMRISVFQAMAVACAKALGRGPHWHV